VVIWYIFSVLVFCTKKNLATLGWPKQSLPIHNGDAAKSEDGGFVRVTTKAWRCQGWQIVFEGKTEMSNASPTSLAEWDTVRAVSGLGPSPTCGLGLC
jgi:hypothetical protein